MTQPRHPLTRPRMLISGEDSRPRDGFTLYTVWHYEMQPAEGHVCDLVWARNEDDVVQVMFDRCGGLSVYHISPVAA